MIVAVLPTTNLAQGPRCSLGVLCPLFSLLRLLDVFNVAGWVFNVAGCVFMSCSITRHKSYPRTRLLSWCAVFNVACWVFKFAPPWVFNVAGWVFNVAGWVFMCCSITRQRLCPRTTLQSWCAVVPVTMGAMD